MKITPKMLEEFKTNIKAWKQQGANKYLQKLYAKERKQLISIYNLCKNGKFREAGNEAYCCVSVVEAQIPTNIYNHIMKAIGHN